MCVIQQTAQQLSGDSNFKWTRRSSEYTYLKETSRHFSSIAMLSRKSFALFLIILINIAVEESQTTGCQEKLGMASGLIKDRQISASSYYGAYRPNFSRFHGDSAWCVSAEKGHGAYLEVDLGEVKRLTWLGIQGHSKGHVTNYTIRYKRRRDNKHWRQLVERMPQNITKIITIHGNSDNSSMKFTKLKGSRIVRFVRIVLLGGVGKHWCLKLELYGCEWKNKDGLISYYSTQGNIRGENETEVIMNDATYDGVAQFLGRRNGVLEGGLGQLTDGDVGGDAFWYDLGNGKSFEWVGWYDLKISKPSIQFDFDSPRKFDKIRFHGNNRPGNVKIFRNLLVAFSMDGHYFSRKFVFHPSYVMRKRKNESMWIDVDLRGHVGKYLNCEFSYDGKWIVLSEIEFESVPVTVSLPKYTKAVSPNTPLTVTTVPVTVSVPKYTKAVSPNTPLIETTDSGPSLRSVARFNVKRRPLSLPAIIGMVAVGLALLVFTTVLIVWLKKRHWADGHDGTHPLRNAVRIVNPLKGGSSTLERGKHHSSSSESDEVDDLVQNKLNNFVPTDHPWYKSLDRYKMNNINRVQSCKVKYEVEEKGDKMDNVKV